MTVISSAETVVGIAKENEHSMFEHTPYQVDRVRALICDSLKQAGLGLENPNSPFNDIVKPGMSVLLKPNWVSHHNASGHSIECLVTHPAFIRTVVEILMLAKPGRIIIGDAPIQGCKFHELISEDWIKEIQSLAPCPVDVIDFRRTIMTENDLTKGVANEQRPSSRYALFDLACDSLIEPVSTKGNLRITMYNPDKLAETHHSKRHQYLLCREAFEADVIINLPKLKTHRKAGITAALKNMVGCNGNKDFLPHHRVGGTGLNGDCYSGVAPLKRLAEQCLDNANRNINTPKYKFWRLWSRRLLKWHSLFGDTEIEGGWYGNDTVWRMVLDLNRLLLYGRADGTLSSVPLRRIYSLTDGIIAGEGDGPLAPKPIRRGIVTFASSSVVADFVHCILMHFDWQRIPLIREAFGNFGYPLTTIKPEDCKVRYENNIISAGEAAEILGYPFEPPTGWKNHIEKRQF